MAKKRNSEWVGTGAGKVRKTMPNKPEFSGRAEPLNQVKPGKKARGKYKMPRTQHRT